MPKIIKNVPPMFIAYDIDLVVKLEKLFKKLVKKLVTKLSFLNIKDFTNYVSNNDLKGKR